MAMTQTQLVLPAVRWRTQTQSASSAWIKFAVLRHYHVVTDSAPVVSTKPLLPNVDAPDVNETSAFLLEPSPEMDP